MYEEQLAEARNSVSSLHSLARSLNGVAGGMVSPRTARAIAKAKVGARSSGPGLMMPVCPRLPVKWLLGTCPGRSGVGGRGFRRLEWGEGGDVDVPIPVRPRSLFFFALQGGSLTRQERKALQREVKAAKKAEKQGARTAAASQQPQQRRGLFGLKKAASVSTAASSSTANSAGGKRGIFGRAASGNTAQPPAAGDISAAAPLAKKPSLLKRMFSKKV